MKVRARINWRLFTQTGLDSGSLTMLGAVIHNFSEPGEYMGTVLRKNEAVESFHLTVDKDCPAMQVDIDLATLHRPASARFECKKGKTGSRFIVNPNGYIVFYVSHGPGGYAVVVGRMDEKNESKLVFDSRKLKEGDLFAATMIRPGTYSVTNINTDAKGEIIVAYPKIGKVPCRPPNPVSIECTKKEFSLDKIEIEAAQGQVFRFKTQSRIKIELIKPDDGPAKKRQHRVSRWRKQAIRQRG